MLNLDSRPALLGVNLATRREKHGDEPVAAKDIRIKNILLTEDELNEFFGDKHAWDMLYVAKASKPAAPFWADKLGALPVSGKWLGSSVTISFGLKPHNVGFTDAKIKRVELEPQIGGLTAMSLTLSCLKRHISGELAMLDDHLDQVVNVAVQFGDPDDNEEGDDEQDELNLDHGVAAAPAKRGRPRKATPTGDALN